MKYLIVTLMWAGYCALHSFLICTWFTNIVSKALKQYYAFYRLFYIVISVVLLVPLIRYNSAIDQQAIIHYGPFLAVVRYILISASLLMFFWTFFVSYDSLSFFGIRQVLNFNKTSPNTSPGEIRKNGMLGIIRHPMYLALIVYLWCQTFRLVDILVNLLLTAYVIIGTLLEEKKLVLEFGEAYTRYKAEVPMLIPFSGRRAKQPLSTT